MNESIAVVVYCVLDMLKYYFCLIYVFDIHIIRRKYAVFALIATASVLCGIGFRMGNGADICYALPNVFMLFFVFLIQRGGRLKGVLYVVLSWIIMDSLTQLIRLFASAMGVGNDALL